MNGLFIIFMEEGKIYRLCRYCGQSSFSHQTYLRRWVKYNKVPVISVDYLKPPKHFYPVPLDDCWQCYNWLLYESHNYFCLRQNKKIILTGDSAGGHFVYALTNLCILVGAPRPDFLLPFYPCKYLVLYRFNSAHPQLHSLFSLYRGRPNALNLIPRLLHSDLHPSWPWF